MTKKNWCRVKFLYLQIFSNFQSVFEIFLFLFYTRLIKRCLPRRFALRRCLIIKYLTYGCTREGTLGRHEPPLCRPEPPRFARQTEPLLSRPSLRYADRASTMQTVPALCRLCLRYAVNEPPPYSTACFKTWFLCVMKILLKIRVIYWLSYLETYMDSKSGL